MLEPRHYKGTKVYTSRDKKTPLTQGQKRFFIMQNILKQFRSNPLP